MKSLEELSKEEKTYLPSKEVQGELARVPLVCVVGGVGVGKNYLMQRTGLPIVGTMTSRPARPTDDPAVYSYYTNEQFAAMIERHELVQYAVDLPNNAMYGSTLHNYVPDTPNLADIWYWSVVELPEKGFRSVRAVSIVTPSKQWQQQLEVRFASRDASYRAARLEEARNSLAWTKQQLLAGNPDHAVIVNDAQATPTSVQLLIDFAHGATLPPAHDALAVIDDMLQFLELSK